MLLVLFIICNCGLLGIASGFFNFTRPHSPCTNNNTISCKSELEDKRGVPTGANPLHNR
ncbi:CLE16 protein [Senna tora]|uniref:CLE16 protein n=1 Tax=Senna tora TaxID=362788 RepID=A0A834SUF0_9FABA|nr:CLE16 protein [Senna tora]